MAVDEPVDIETTGTRVVYENKWMNTGKINSEDGTIGYPAGITPRQGYVLLRPPRCLARRGGFLRVVGGGGPAPAGHRSE
jgi:hypothetical protein